MEVPMVEEVLYTGQMRSENLLLLIADCGIPENDRRILFLAENLPTHVIDPQQRQDLLLFDFYSPTLKFANYTSGRIFHPDWELRWEHRDANAHVIYLGKQSQLVKQAMIQHHMQLKGQENLAESEREKLIDLHKLGKHERHYYLFGKRLEDNDVKQIGKPVRIGDFAELRIHRVLRYPAPGSMSTGGQGRVKLTVREYLDSDTGQVQFFRFQDLKEASENEEQAG
jgi:hypothetical protein